MNIKKLLIAGACFASLAVFAGCAASEETGVTPPPPTQNENMTGNASQQSQQSGSQQQAGQPATTNTPPPPMTNFPTSQQVTPEQRQLIENIGNGTVKPKAGTQPPGTSTQQ